MEIARLPEHRSTSGLGWIQPRRNSDRHPEFRIRSVTGADSLFKKRKELLQLGLVRVAPVFADFEGLGVTNRVPLFLPVEFDELGAKSIGLALIPIQIGRASCRERV